MKTKRSKKRKQISEAMTIQLDAAEMLELINEDVIYGQSSIIGMRKNQQDACFVERVTKENYTIAIICDGMGGLSGGAQASNNALNYIAKQLHAIQNVDQPEKEMEAIVREADEIIYDLTDENGNYMKSGTTVVAVLIKENNLHWVSVGDSKIFILKNGALQCVTDQHNYQFMAEKRKDDDTFVFNPDLRQDALVSYLGAGNLPYIDLSPPEMILDDGDMLLLCSDGLYNTVPEQRIKEIMLEENTSMHHIAQRLTESAMEFAVAQGRQNQDNTTVIVLKYKKED